MSDPGMSIDMDSTFTKEAIRQYVTRTFTIPPDMEIREICPPNHQSTGTTVVLGLKKPEPKNLTAPAEKAETFGGTLPLCVAHQRETMLAILGTFKDGASSQFEQEEALSGLDALWRLASFQLGRFINGLDPSQRLLLPGRVSDWATGKPFNGDALSEDEWLVFRYKNHDGKVEMRAACRPRVTFGSSAHHRRGSLYWIMEAFDLRRWTIRDFALDDVEYWGFLPGPIPELVANRIKHHHLSSGEQVRGRILADTQVSPPSPYSLIATGKNPTRAIDAPARP